MRECKPKLVFREDIATTDPGALVDWYLTKPGSTVILR
jgi:hypothetical protein